MVACAGSPFRSQPPSDGIQAQGAENAFFALQEGSCEHGTYEIPTGPRFLTYDWPAPRGSVLRPAFVIDGYHGVGTYAAAWPTAAGRNTRIELHDGNTWWMADAGTITVTEDDRSHFRGVLAARGMRRFTPAGQSPLPSTPVVDLEGSWSCTLAGSGAV